MQPRRNEQIRVPEVRLVGPEGNMIGVVPIDQAIAMAREAELDLVEIAPEARPPVCRIIDFGKWMFEKRKRDREQRKKQKEKIQKLKEMQLGPKISSHDFDFKLKHTHEFLSEGDKVKVVMLLRGREVQHADLAVDIMKRFAAGLNEVSTVERQPLRESARRIVMMLAPRKTG